MSDKTNVNNRANQKNPNNEEYWQSRGLNKPTNSKTGEFLTYLNISETFFVNFFML